MSQRRPQAMSDRTRWRRCRLERLSILRSQDITPLSSEQITRDAAVEMSDNYDSDSSFCSEVLPLSQPEDCEHSNGASEGFLEQLQSTAVDGSHAFHHVPLVWDRPGHSKKRKKRQKRKQRDVCRSSLSSSELDEADASLLPLLQQSEGDCADVDLETLAGSQQLLTDINRIASEGEDPEEGEECPDGLLFTSSNGDSEDVVELDGTVCVCTSTTQGEILIMVLSLGLRHNLSYKAMIDILKMINAIYRHDVIPPSLYRLLKFASPDRSGDTYHVYCPKCNVYLQSCKEQEMDVSLVCNECGHSMPTAKNVSDFFMTLGMKEQVKHLLERPGIAEATRYRFKRKKIQEDALEDVYDGQLYKSLSQENGPLSLRYNLSYSFNTDGVAYGKSSYQEIWPIFVMINELPPKMRVENMLLVGLWVGKGAPVMNVFLEPFVQQANDLSSNGVDWQLGNNIMTSLVFPLFSVVDSQARWRMLNLTAPTGYYGCTFCEHPTDPSSRGRRFGMSKVYSNRTDESLRECMLTAYDKRHLPRAEKREKGSQGPTCLMNLDHFDLGRGMVPDSLHYLKGVGEQHVGLILKKLDDDDILKISERLLKLCTPSSVTRTPRSLKFREKFKASEWRALLVLYGPVVMHGIVPDKYVSHLSLLSFALHHLHQKSVAVSKLDHLHEVLLWYCMLYETYFGISCMTHNVHLLTHIVPAVCNVGPIWTHTCYPFEGKNSFLLHLAKSPFVVAKVVARKYHLFRNLPSLSDKVNMSERTQQFCKCVSRKGGSETVKLCGSGKNYVLSDEQHDLISSFGNLNTRSCLNYEVIIVRGVRFTTKTYGHSKKKSDSGIYLRNGKKAVIENIFKFDLFNNGVPILLARQVIESEATLWKIQNFKINHITKCLGNGPLIAVDPSCVLGQCMFMTTDKGVFATRVPYGCVNGD